MNMEMAERILQLRKSNGLSQEDLADKIGVSRQAVSKWESGQSMPDLDKIILMSDLFEVTTDYILKGTDKLLPADEPLSEDQASGNHHSSGTRISFLYPGMMLLFAAIAGILAYVSNRFAPGECVTIALAGAAAGLGVALMYHAFE